jgi:hypothetical protein
MSTLFVQASETPYRTVHPRGIVLPVLLTAEQALSHHDPQQADDSNISIDYVETAPWNIKAFTQAMGLQPRFSAVGTRLLEAAIRLSIDEGFKGRVGLHSLPASEGFYLSGCGMTGVERDPNKQNLLWCEFTPEQAERFLRGER